MQDEPIALPAAQYVTLNEAPAHLRNLDGGRLTVEQVNWLNARAVELGEWQTVDLGNGNTGCFHNPKEEHARAEFKASNHIENDFWVKGAPDGDA